MSKIELIYVGRVEGKNNTVIQKYLERYTLEPMLFKKKVGNGLHSIGIILECETTETGVKGPFTHIGNEQNTEDIRRWIIRDKAVYDEYLLFNSMKKKLPDRTSEAVQTLRKSYKELSSNQRQNFINRIIREIIS